MTTHRPCFWFLFILLAVACEGESSFIAPADGDTDAATRDADADSDTEADVASDATEADATMPPPDTSSEDEDADAEAPEVAQPQTLLATGMTIADVDLYQTVRVPWVASGSPVSSQIPVVAGRDTLVRVRAQVSAAPAAPVRLEAVLGDESVTRGEAVAVSSPEATLELRLSGAQVTPFTALTLRLVVDAGGEAPPEDGAHPAAWPAVGTAAPLGATEVSGPLQVRIVPLRDDRNGVGRMPDVGPEQLGRFQALLEALYPATEVQIDVHEVIGWTAGPDFGDINTYLVQLKEDERAPDAMYYYAVLKPADSFEEYCFGTCTTGQSFTVSDGGSGIYRVGSGVGFSGERWAWTLAHELGHMHGRGHAPCNVSWWSDDNNYPHSGGDIGVEGWDMRDGSIKPAGAWTDVMGYCDNLWISDYTYLGLFDRARDINPGAGQARPLRPEPRMWRVYDVEEGAWGRALRLSDTRTGVTRSIAYLNGESERVGAAEVSALTLSHGGEILVVPWPLPEGAEDIGLVEP